MKKSELKTGMIAETRNGDRYLVMRDPNVKGRDLIRFGGGFMLLERYNDDLILDGDLNEFDIVKVYSAGASICFLLGTDIIGGKLNLKLIWERPKPILDEVEKEYLGAMIKPFRKEVQDIAKRFIAPGLEYIRIRYDDRVWRKTTIVLPTFHRGTMYKGMELDKDYSLEELGL